MRIMKNIAGVIFGQITAIKPTGRCSSGDKRWEFSCSCGNVFEANGYYARIGKITTCPVCSKNRVSLASVTHGMSSCQEYHIWEGIKTRCYNKKRIGYKNYGGRGIRVCDRWLSDFKNFYGDMGERPSINHSIERKDNNGNYEPSNCYWATLREQSNNKRNSKNIPFCGEVKKISDVAGMCGLKYATIWNRVKNGWADEELASASNRGGTIVMNGVRDTYDGWSRRTRIKPSTIAMRITAYKWPIEKALTKGAKFCE